MISCMSFSCKNIYIRGTYKNSKLDKKTYKGKYLGRNVKKKTFIATIAFLIISIGIAIYILYQFNYIPHKQYSNEDFKIKTYISDTDKDNDGTDDQADILDSVRKYIATNPKYKSKYYESGYPDDDYGVCTDVVSFGLFGAGYDLMDLVNKYSLANRGVYNIDTVDERIDFRRVLNLKIYFTNSTIALTIDIKEIEEWQGGDIVIFKNHIGIVSDKRNKNGVPFIIHHRNPYQKYYEEDILERRSDIVGHYRIS